MGSKEARQGPTVSGDELSWLSTGVSVGLAILAGSISVQSAARADDIDLGTRDALTGNWGGARTSLSKMGIDWNLTYTGEVFSNMSGGLTRGTAYEDLIDLELESDLNKLFGWKGGTAHLSLYQINDSGRNAGDLVGAISDISGIDARPAFRLFTLYVQQELGSAGSLRIGQIAADDEFVISDTAALLVNGSFGWANPVDDNLPGGGPAYPLATPGIRLKLDPSEEVKVLAAIFSGNPAGDCAPNEKPEVCNKHGTTFSFTGGALFMGEVQYRPNAKLNGHGDGGPPESAYRLGGWYHNDEFPDLANPKLEREGNWSIYGIFDQAVWRNASSALTLFLGVAATPEDRSPISFYIDGGFGIYGPLASRPDDVIIFGVAYSDISSDLEALNKATRRATGISIPIQDSETAIELTYIAQVTPWWTLQPDLQYIIHPGGNVPSPNNPTRAVEDSFLVGFRTRVTF